MNEPSKETLDIAKAVIRDLSLEDGARLIERHAFEAVMREREAERANLEQASASRDHWKERHDNAVAHWHAEAEALLADNARLLAFVSMHQTNFHSTPFWQDGAWCIPRLMDGAGGLGSGVVYDRYESFTAAIDEARKATP